MTRASKASLVSLFSLEKGFASGSWYLLVAVLGFHGGVLLVLVLGDQVAHVLVGFLELHLVHALALVPVEERLALVHGAELGRQALKDAFERCGVGDEGAARLVIDGRTFYDAGLLVVRDPLDVVVAVRGLALLADLVHLLGLHRSTEDERGRHVLSIVRFYVREEVAW